MQEIGTQAGAKIRVLDVGCGGGDTVAWLVERGWDVYGVDISNTHVERGRAYLRQIGSDPNRIQLIREDLTYPFPDAFFDFVLSNQVIEHVAELESFGKEIARVSAHGGAGLHIYPAKWRPIEVHTRIPFAHWLPKGRISRAAIAGALRLGMGAPYFEGFSHRDRLEIFAHFNETETFYRPVKQVVSTLERFGLMCDADNSSRDKVYFHFPGIPEVIMPVSAWLYRNIFSVVLHTQKA